MSISDYETTLGCIESTMDLMPDSFTEEEAENLINALEEFISAVQASVDKASSERSDDSD